MRKAGQNLSKRLRPHIRRHCQQIANEAMALFPKDHSDPISDSLFGPDAATLKNNEVQWRFKLSTQERFNKELLHLVPQFGGRVRDFIRTGIKRQIEGGVAESLFVNERKLQLEMGHRNEQGPDFKLETLPRKLARFRDRNFEIEDHPSKYQTSKAFSETETIRKMIQTMKQFEDSTGVWDTLDERDAVISNLPRNLKLTDILQDSSSTAPNITKSAFDIHGSLASVRIRFTSKENKLQFYTKFHNKRYGVRQLKIYISEQVKQNENETQILNQNDNEMKRNVVFLNLPDESSESEILISLSQFGNITRYECPRVEIDGVMGTTSELTDFLRKNGGLRGSNVRAMEFGANGWKLVRLEEEKDFKHVSMERYLESTIANLIEESESHQMYLRKDYDK